MSRVVQRFIRRHAPQAQILAEGHKQGVVDRTTVFGSDFEGQFEEAVGRFDVDRALQQIVQGCARFVQGGLAPVISFPDGISHFNERQVQNQQALALQRDFRDEPCGLS
jgi:hypothetical protein